MVRVCPMGQGQPGGSSAPLSKGDSRSHRGKQGLDQELPIQKTEGSEIAGNVTTMARRGLCPVDGFHGCNNPRQCLQHSTFIHWPNGYYEVRCALAGPDAPYLLHKFE